jgi:GNAT superfamily N-acetyltransferase
MLAADDASDLALLDTLCRVVNEAYALAEAGLWRHDYARTSVTEMSAAIRRGQVAVARLDNRPVGSIGTRQLDSETGWFGVLAVDPPYGARGIGRELVAFAESRAASAGSTTMQLELLAPTQIKHAHSELLADWYRRLGYREVSRSSLLDVEPEALPFLATPCEIVVHRKQLGPQLRPSNRRER